MGGRGRLGSCALLISYQGENTLSRARRGVSPRDVSSQITPDTLTTEPSVLDIPSALLTICQGKGSLRTFLALSRTQQVAQGWALGALPLLYFCLPLLELGTVLQLSPSR